jgi:hypothetical protein
MIPHDAHEPPSGPDSAGTTFEVLARFGTLGLARFVGALLLFLLLHLARMPLVILARVIEVCLCRVDAYATRQATTPASACPRPHTQWFTPTAKEARAHAYTV